MSQVSALTAKEDTADSFFFFVHIDPWLMWYGIIPTETGDIVGRPNTQYQTNSVVRFFQDDDLKFPSQALK
jgi:hypothetical protein